MVAEVVLLREVAVEGRVEERLREPLSSFRALVAQLVRDDDADAGEDPHRPGVPRVLREGPAARDGAVDDVGEDAPVDRDEGVGDDAVVALGVEDLFLFRRVVDAVLADEEVEERDEDERDERREVRRRTAEPHAEDDETRQDEDDEVRVLLDPLPGSLHVRSPIGGRSPGSRAFWRIGPRARPRRCGARVSPAPSRW